MTSSGSSNSPLRLERLLEALPRSKAVRPLVARLLASSRADETRRWTVSGELGTAAGRIVDVQAFRAEAERWVEEARAGLERRAGAVEAVAEALGAANVARVIDVLLTESGALETAGSPAEAETWAEAAFRLALGQGSPRAAEARRREARCARARGDLCRAAAIYEDAWTRATDSHLSEDAVIAATGRGNVAVDRGRWSEAEGWYGKAMAVLDAPERRLDEATTRALRWRLCQDLGITHRERGDLDGSEEWYRRAEDESRGLDDPAAVIEIENGRGQLALARGDLPAAEARFRRALDVMTDPRPDPVRVAVRSNLAEALFRRGRTLEAGVVAREAEAEAIRGGHASRLPEVYRVLARIVAARGEGQAVVLVERALELVREAGLPALEEARTLRTWADLREARGEEEMAAEARARAADILEDLEDDDPSRQGGAS
jgi:tetratricopeptide (TPR) repeat protein